MLDGELISLKRTNRDKEEYNPKVDLNPKGTCHQSAKCEG